MPINEKGEIVRSSDQRPSITPITPRMISRRSKPMGLVLITSYFGFIGLLDLWVGIVAMLDSSASVIVFGAIAFVLLGTATGLWKMKDYGRFPAIMIGILSLVCAFLLVFNSFIFGFIGIIVNGGIVIYLNKEDVKILFD